MTTHIQFTTRQRSRGRWTDDQRKCSLCFEKQFAKNRHDWKKHWRGDQCSRAKMKPDRIISEDMWAADRDERFIERLISDVTPMMEAGVPREYIVKTIKTFDYVRTWRSVPSWAWPARKIPRGCKWKDGAKYSHKGGKDVRSETYILLENGEDLYIKGIILPGMNIKDRKIIRIQNFRKLPANVVATYFGGFLGDSILKYWHERGLWLGYALPFGKRVTEEGIDIEKIKQSLC